MQKIKFHTILLCGSVLSTPAFAQVAISALPAASALGGTEVVPVVQSGTTKKTAVSNIGPVIGTTPIISGANTKVLYDNSAIVGEYTVSGTGNVAMTTNPVFTTPNIGVPSFVTLTNGTGLPISTGVSGLGTGVGTALGVNVGTAGSPVVNGGALGTPSSGNLANASGLVPSTGLATTGTANSSTYLEGDNKWVTLAGSGTVTNVATGNCLTGGPITTTGTIQGTYLIDARTTQTETINANDACRLVTFSNASAVAVNIAAATGAQGLGWSVDLENFGAGAVTVTPTTSTINGAATLVIPQNMGCTLVSDNTNYQVSQCTAVIPKATSAILGLSSPDNVTIKATAGVYADQYPTSGDIMVSAGNGAVPTGTVPGTGFLTASANNTNGAGGFCVIGANACAYKSATIGWIATVNPNNAGVLVFPAAATLVSLVGSVETATGSAATVSVNVASSGTACSAGTTVHSGSFNANGTAATNQTLTLTTTAITSGQRLCLQTTGTTSWTGGTGVGTLTVTYTIP